MSGVLSKEVFEDGACFPLIRASIVVCRRIGADSQGIEDSCFDVLWITLVDLLHRFFVVLGASSMGAFVGIFVENLHRGDVLALALRFRASGVCFLDGGRTYLQIARSRRVP